MPNGRRLKVKGAECFYHVWAKAASYLREYPLAREGAAQELVRLMRFYLQAYFCDLASYQVLGNHYHMTLRFEARRPVSREELMDRARRLYPSKSEGELSAWGEEKWRRLEERLFDLSELMRNIQQSFALWFNRRFGRSGSFWGSRFGSTVLAGGEAVLEGMLYVDLNAFRAGLCGLPWEWEQGSAYWRERGEDGWLLELSEALPQLRGGLDEYRRLLAHRAGLPEAGEAGGGAERGAYGRRRGFFSRGLVVGGREEVSQWLKQLRASGRYKRRRHPVEQEGTGLWSLRGPRRGREPG